MIGNEVLRDIYSETDKTIRVKGNFTPGGNPIKIKHSQNLAIVPFEYITNIPELFYFRGLTVSFTNGEGVSVNVNETISVIIDDSDDNFDTVILKESTTNSEAHPTSSFAFFPDSNIEIFGQLGTQLKVRVSNNGGNGVANVMLFLEVK